MLGIIRLLAEELGLAFIQPKLHQIRVNIKLALVTVSVIALFSVLGMACLFLFVFLSVAKATTPQEAALILFGFCVLVCLGAVAAHALGKISSAGGWKAGSAFASGFSFPEARLPDLKIGRRAKDAFADNKLTALLVMGTLGLLIGARPGPSFRAASRIVTGRSRSKLRDKGVEDREYRHPRP